MDLEKTLADMIEEAEHALRAGDAADAERRAKAISALVRARTEVAAFLAAERARAPEEDEEALRAELRRRLALYVDAANAGAPDDTLRRLAAEAAAP